MLFRSHAQRRFALFVVCEKRSAAADIDLVLRAVDRQPSRQPFAIFRQRVASAVDPAKHLVPCGETARVQVDRDLGQTLLARQTEIGRASRRGRV